MFQAISMAVCIDVIESSFVGLPILRLPIQAERLECAELAPAFNESETHEYQLHAAEYWTPIPLRKRRQAGRTPNAGAPKRKPSHQSVNHIALGFLNTSTGLSLNEALRPMSKSSGVSGQAGRLSYELPG